MRLLIALIALTATFAVAPVVVGQSAALACTNKDYKGS